ncbi:hypothetical protein [Novosphingobium sp. M1R2S20]|uniref:Uncharacterized protein n=1 Tax=Novosphingobium rhizovicinum TaxID=3228928 RepID=A0ABV3RCY0_9SPHN
MTDRIIDILNDLSRSLQIPVLTPEYEIVLFLLERSGATADELLKNSSLSSAGCYKTIERLKHWGVVNSEPGEFDRRCRHYRLSPRFEELVLTNFKRYLVSHASFATLGINPGELEGRNGVREPDDRLDHLSCEYEILLYLYLQPHLANSDLSELVGSSTTKFNLALGNLSRLGLITYNHAPSDKRRKLYSISGEARAAIEAVHQRVSAWLDCKWQARAL